MSTENQVHLIGTYRTDELLASEAISPGHLVQEDSSGEVGPHDVEGGKAAFLIAEVDALQGEGLDDDYADGDLVQLLVEVSGNELQMFLKAGENVAIGDYLISAGDGTLIADGSETSGTTVEQRIAMAREAEDLSGSGAVDTLMRVMLL